MKRPIKVFVASSSAKKGLADALCIELQETAKDYKLEIKAQAWHRDVDILGETILKALVEQCGGNDADVVRSDYFIALLTRDDLREKKGEWTETPRDNCIFELGLFMGGLGFQHRRCFMLCSVSKDALPSDLEGSTFVSFTEPDTQTPGASREAMKIPASRIVTQVLSMKHYVPSGIEFMTTDDLLERERPLENSGDLEEGAEVLVNRLQPIEEWSPEFAERVNANLRAEIRYRYFFHDLSAMRVVARLLYRIATARPAGHGLSSPALQDAEIASNLQLMAERLFIHFLPSNGPIEFCIHNAQYNHAAACYVRFPFENKHIPFAQKQSAYAIAKELTDLGESGDPPRMFCKTHSFDLTHADNKRHMEELRRHLATYFKDPALQEILWRCCFGGS